MPPTPRPRRGYSPAEYQAFKARCARALPFRVSLRYHTEAYVRGAIDLRPHAAGSPGHRWTPDQYAAVRAFVVAEGCDMDARAIFDGPNSYYCHAHGLNYLYQGGTPA
jgi:hypothetical protein